MGLYNSIMLDSTIHLLENSFDRKRISANPSFNHNPKPKARSTLGVHSPA